MAAPYSLDLRCKVVQSCNRPGHSQHAVAEFFGVSLSFVEALLRRVRRRGELVLPWHPPRAAGTVNPVDCLRLQRWLQKQPDLTLAELAELAQRLQAGGGPAVSTPTVCRALQCLGLHRKKPYTLQSATQRRYIRHVVDTGKALPMHAPTRLKFVDESGVNIAMTRRYGRAKRGQRVHDAVPKS